MSKDNGFTFLLADALALSLKCKSGCTSAETFAQTSRCTAAPGQTFG